MAKAPLTLEMSITKAKQLNLRTNVEKHNIHARSVDIKKAQADTLPTIHLTSDYERLSGVNTLLNSVDLSWDASAFAKDPGKSKNLLLKAAEEKKSMTEAFLVYQVKEGYYRLIQFKQRLIVLQKSLNLLIQQRAITEQFVTSGLKQASALSRIDDQINSTKTSILFKKGSIAQTRSALLQLINIPDSAGEKFADYDGNLTPLPERSQVLAKVLQNAPNIQSMIFEQHAVAETVHKPMDGSTAGCVVKCWLPTGMAY